RLSPRDPQALLAECLAASRQMRDWPSDRELATATSACTDAAQADPQSTDALYELAKLYDKTCDDGPRMEALKAAAGRASKFDGRSLPRVKFYLASVALQHRRTEAEAASADVLALLSREGASPLQGAHLLRAALLLRLGREDDAEREIEAELAA